VLAFQNREVAGEERDSPQQTSVGTKESKDYYKQESEEVEHGGQVVTDGILACLRKSLISKQGRNCGE